MTKSCTTYWAFSADNGTLEVVVNNEAKNSDHIQVKAFDQVWRTKAMSIKYFEWVIEQLKSLPNEKS